MKRRGERLGDSSGDTERRNIYITTQHEFCFGISLMISSPYAQCWKDRIPSLLSCRTSCSALTALSNVRPGCPVSLHVAVRTRSFYAIPFNVRAGTIRRQETNQNNLCLVKFLLHFHNRVRLCGILILFYICLYFREDNRRRVSE